MMNAIGIVKQFRQGDDVEARCGKCKDIRTHAIVALNGSLIARVRCRTCQSEHNYRNPVKETKTRSATGTGRTAGPGRPSASQVVPTGTVKIYSPQQKFGIGDQVSHPTFGMGLVVDVRERKIDVKFGREAKVLVHAG